MFPILTVVGARPQFIKAAVVSRALADAGLDEILVHTGQHYDVAMSGAFFDELGLPAPAHALEVGSASHGVQTGRMLAAVEEIIVDRQPGLVLVYGDTNSTLAGALAAAKLHVPVAHVEAGLRSFNRRMPEEVNRVVADHLADILFAPSDVAVTNLRAEGIVDGVHHVGDVMFDLALLAKSHLHGRRGVRDELGVRDAPYALATIHRAENTDDPARLDSIVDGLAIVAADLPVILPLHPRTSHVLAERQRTPPGVTVVDPVGYLDMADLLRGACVVVTDSGGVQKEAFFHSRPCVTLRGETEWTELVDLGWNTLAPPAAGAAAIAATVRSRFGTTGADAAPYGKGDAAARIAAVLRQR